MRVGKDVGTNRVAPERQGRRCTGMGPAGRWLAFLGLLLGCGNPAASSPATWSFIPLEETGARDFIDTNSHWDGRGVVIAVLDTGVDMGVSGLLETSEGKPKVIDVRDFSGQGKIDLEKIPLQAEHLPDTLTLKDGRRLRNLGKLAVQPVERFVMAGFLQEDRFRDSDVHDLNGNGREDDAFGVLAFKAGKVDAGGDGWIVIVDTDGDGEMDDERAFRSYGEGHETFTLKPGGSSQATPHVLTFAPYIEDDDQLVLHFDDGGHGTHVSGIAAAYRVHDRDGFNGVAPGAQILSLKIGNNNLSGSATTTGSMKEALEFASDYARENGVPVVVNLSYGIGSAVEGRSRIDKLLDQLISDNSLLAASVSAGNEGPGISSIGTPAASALAFTAGAMLSRKTAQVHYGADLPQDIVFLFSSRGGELLKPDAVAPGSASSSVPPWEKNDLYNGTSMAAPQITGALALLISAAEQHDPPIAWNAGLLKRAIRMTASPIPGATTLDAGAGVVQIGAAFEALKALAGDPDEAVLIGFQTETYCPAFEDGKGPAAYWRAGAFVPPSTSPQMFAVKALFKDGTDPETRQGFYRSYKLESSAPWLKPAKPEIYLRGENPASVAVLYDKSKLAKPGLYTGTVRARRAHTRGQVDFELQSTVIVPFGFGPENSYQASWRSETLEPAEIKRLFLAVPPAASSMVLSLEVGNPEQAKARLRVFDPEGIESTGTQWAGADAPSTRSVTLAGKLLTPGTWEVVVESDMQNRFPVNLETEASFMGLAAEPEVVERFEEEPGEMPSARMRIINLYNQPFRGSARSRITGFERTALHVVEDDDTFSRDFTMDGTVESVVFEIDMDAETYNLFTDIAVNIYSPEGKALSKSALGSKHALLGLVNPDPAESQPKKYTFRISGAFADEADKKKPWRLSLKERHSLRDQQEISVTRFGGAEFSIEPGVAAQLVLSLNRRPVAPPAGFQTSGFVELLDGEKGLVRLQVPILLR